MHFEMRIELCTALVLILIIWSSFQNSVRPAYCVQPQKKLEDTSESDYHYNFMMILSEIPPGLTFILIIWEFRGQRITTAAALISLTNTLWDTDNLHLVEERAAV